MRGPGQGLISRLRRMPRYAPDAWRPSSAYADRLVLAKASGDHTTLDHVRAWVERGPRGRRRAGCWWSSTTCRRSRSAHGELEPETEVTTFLTQGLKEMAMALGIPVIAIAASDRMGLKSKRMRLSDLRGSSALQYEADIGLILNNKYAILSREHMVYNLLAGRGDAQLGRDERREEPGGPQRGRHGVPARCSAFPHRAAGDFVRERLVDEKVVLE